MCETDLLSLNRLLDNSDIPVMGASSFCYCLYFLLTHHFLKIVLWTPVKWGETLQFSKNK